PHVLCGEHPSRDSRCTVLRGKDGQSGLDLHRSQKIDCIMTELYLPDMSGYERWANGDKRRELLGDGGTSRPMARPNPRCVAVAVSAICRREWVRRGSKGINEQATRIS